MRDKRVLSDLGQLKGALSDRELAFILGLNITEATCREKRPFLQYNCIKKQMI
jgi:hypothetical protein